MTGLLLDRAVQPRNGLPGFRPYVYRGTGEDTLTAHIVFPEDETDGKPWLQPCGTPAAYRRHLRNSEEPCPECTEANRQAQADRHASRLRSYTAHEDFGGHPRCGAVAAQVLAEPGQEVTCKRCIAYAEEAGALR